MRVYVKGGTGAGIKDEYPVWDDWTCECGYENPGSHRQCGRQLKAKEGTEGQGFLGGPLYHYCGKPRGGVKRIRGARDIMDLNPSKTDFERARREERPTRWSQRDRMIRRQKS